ncbi:PucR family transcriptional regulator [Streptomyces tsukubensis]|uniref:Transcriptional regulator n=1 Tax=Streptomyces tsukubensis TaxID=83656 RepID=A0A1V4AFS2_9ACTN|nr:PucR family transcriptional regulator [Streptomyces tsukubensis]OON82387.1 transcriptional regulator [Streptomyces tsukubensis]QFR92887.1 PucR family transcriptional regulator [Streptomyces tsukubensis]
MDTQGGITVRRALELPALRGGLPEVVARADRLGQTVRWVHAGEVPHIASLLKGGELLLITGLGLGGRAAEQRAFVRGLAERGIAALVVELGSRFDRLPAPLVESATQAGLVLVQLHREVPFVAVTEEIHTEIVNGHYARLQQAEEVHSRCTRAVLGGGGAPQVLGVLGDFTGNPVFLETAEGRLLYAASAPSADTEGADPLQVWEGLRGGRTANGDTPPAGSVLVDVPGTGHGTGGSVRARLVLLPVVAPLLPVHRMAAERAAGILAVVLMQARQDEELAARGRGDFLTDLSQGRVAAQDAPAQAAVLGFKPGDARLLPVVMRLADIADGLSSGGGWAVLVRAVSEELAGVGVPVLLGVRPVEGRVPLLLALRSPAERSATADRVAAALRAGVERSGLLGAGAGPPVVVVGGAGGWAAAAAGLGHAAETATAAQGLADRPWYDARRLDTDLLLWRLRDHPDLSAFVDRALGPLLLHDRLSKPPLLPTLAAYLTHAGRKAEAARELHLNRQTLYNRLARIADLLGTDLDDPQTVLALSLALRARRHV